MTPIPGKLYKTITRVGTWQLGSSNSVYTDRDDDRSWTFKQSVEPGVVLMLVRTLPRYNLDDDSPGCIHELVDQNGVFLRVYLNDAINYGYYFEPVPTKD
jgi:hypothetical protein